MLQNILNILASLSVLAASALAIIYYARQLKNKK